MSDPTNTFDLLTGLSNRYYFYEQLRSQTDLARERGYGLGVMLVDIYHLKMINDYCGLVAGDDALKWTANLLKTLARSEDIVTRCRSDEFGLILPVCAEAALKEFGQQVAERVNTTPFVWERVYQNTLTRFTIQMVVSVGAVHFPKEASSDIELMHLVTERLADNQAWQRTRTVPFAMESETFPVE